MRYTLGARSAPVITYAEAAAHLNVLDTRRRTEIVSAVEDACDLVETEIEGTIGTRTVTAVFHADDVPRLPYGPARSITSVTNADGDPVTYTRETFGNEDRLVFTAKAVHPITAVYVAGHDPLPGGLRRVILAHVTALFDVRGTEDNGGKPQAWIERTINFYRRTASVQG